MKKLLVAASAIALLSVGAASADTLKVHEAAGASLSVVFGETTSNQDLPVEMISPNAQTTPVPLPAAGWMLLAGLGAIAAMRRRAKA
jgi:opacity protein-like surface antigen